jgi:hypothetical protein
LSYNVITKLSSILLTLTSSKTIVAYPPFITTLALLRVLALLDKGTKDFILIYPTLYKKKKYYIPYFYSKFPLAISALVLLLKFNDELELKLMPVSVLKLGDAGGCEPELPLPVAPESEGFSLTVS